MSDQFDRCMRDLALLLANMHQQNAMQAPPIAAAASFARRYGRRLR